MLDRQTRGGLPSLASLSQALAASWPTQIVASPSFPTGAGCGATGAGSDATEGSPPHARWQGLLRLGIVVGATTQQTAHGEATWFSGPLEQL